jgi:DNA gyrase subunit B
MSEANQNPNYSADSIQALEGMEHVRMRPSMYIGDVGVRGLHHLLYEVVDNSIDEALAGHCDTISVTINEDNSITTEDNGRGIPVGIHKKEGVSALEVVMTKIGAGGKFDKDSYKVSGGLHGVGVSCVNALSEQLKATVYREGKVWEQKYERGKPLAPVVAVGDSNKNGTVVTFKPDPQIFQPKVKNEKTMKSQSVEENNFSIEDGGYNPGLNNFLCLYLHDVLIQYDKIGEFPYLNTSFFVFFKIGMGSPSGHS